MSEPLVFSINVGLLLVVLWALLRGHPSHAHPLYRAVEGRWLSGVCIGIARQCAIPVEIVRLGFVAALWLGAHAILAYIALEIVIRWDPVQRHMLWSSRVWRRLRAVAAR